MEAPGVLRDRDAQRHRTGIGELARVREQVLQHLLQPLFVRDNRRWDGRAVDLDSELETLLLGDRPEGAIDVIAHVGERDVLDVDVHAPGLDLGEIEDVVDQRQQVAACAVDRPRELDLLAAEVAGRVLAEKLRQDQQRVQRRAQLVRHVREEFRLVLRRERELLGLLLERRARLLDLLVLDLDPPVLLCEQLSFLLELLVRLLQLLLLLLQQLFARLQRSGLHLELGVRALQLFLLRLQLLGTLLELLGQLL